MRNHLFTVNIKGHTNAILPDTIEAWDDSGLGDEIDEFRDAVEDAARALVAGFEKRTGIHLALTVEEG